MGVASSPVRVAVDALGGDHGLSPVVEGALRAARDLGIAVRLVGPEGRVSEALRRVNAPALPIDVVDAPDEIEMAEKVTRAALKKRSSILVAAELVRDGQADAFFSAGNTAACWTIARSVLGTLPEVDRPALAAVMPNVKSRTVLLDAGANANCKARHLEEFAVMGDAYTRAVFGTPSPRVGLMSVGEEETKGNELTRQVHDVLRGSSLNFVGNVEGRDVFNGNVDVVVVDGFTGNVLLKASESLAESMMGLLREELHRTLRRRLGAWLCRSAFRAVRTRTNPAEYGGAPLLGLRGCCVIGHGRSSAHAIRQGIRTAADFARSGVNELIERELRTLAARREVPRMGAGGS